MSTDQANIIHYFHDCYRADNRELLLYDFLDKKVEDKFYFEGQEELLNGNYPLIPIDSDKASIVLKKLEVFQKEKELLYGSFFICGHYIDFKGDTKRLCAPLFYHPAEIQQKDEFHYLSIHTDERRVNYPLINLLTKDAEEDILHDPLFSQLPKGFIRFENIRSIVNLCQKYFPQVDHENIYAYPENATLRKVKSTITRLGKEGSDTYTLLPTSMLGIVSKSSNTRGVLNELSELFLCNELSIPLRALFSELPLTTTKNDYKRGNLPMILSEAQQAILKSSSVNPLTLIVGPPGTGKTYTIGAIAIEHMSRGESVLIASRTDEAVDVIVQKIIGQIGIERCVVRGGRKRSYSTPLNRFLKALLTKVNKLKYLLKEFELSTSMNQYALNNEIKRLSAFIENGNAALEELETSFSKEVENEKKWGHHLSKGDNSVWNRLKTQYFDIRNFLQTPIWVYSEQLHYKDEEQIADVLKLIRLQYVSQIVSVLTNHWNDIKNFREGLMMSSDTEKLNKFKQIDFSAVLKAFPIWMTNLSDVKELLPFKKELFDVVIIDEATQCDIASCLPLIQRAKRVVFAGDPNQLRHVSFLSKGIQSIFRDKYNIQHLDDSMLNYRDNSMLDLVMSALQSGDQVAMLDEHFRSLSPIISFSNQQFYDGELKIMTARPDEKEQGLYFIQCNGKRNKDGSNIEEAEQILVNVRALLSEEQDLTQELCTSLGILSPFRAQVDLLAKLLLERFTIVEIEKHNIRVGTAYSFQGEERDVMHLSFAVDPESHHSAFVHINKEDVFNVSITRARKRQYIYLSVSKNDLKGGSLLRSYLTPSILENSKKAENQTTHDKFLKEVVASLQSWKINTYWAAFSIAGMKVDLLLKLNNRYVGIDLVGYPGEFADIFGIDRYRVLNRAGVVVFPLPYSDWHFEIDHTKRALKDFLFSKNGASARKPLTS